MSEYAEYKVLVVDDDNLNRKVIQMLLNGLGCQNDAVGSGQEALQRCAGERYDLILMDYEMPDMNGMETAAAIRQLEQRQVNGKPVPIIALSGHSGPEEKARCLAAGMNDYLIKPLTSGLLRETLGRFLGQGEAG
jgi:CheY-like chemotaxis protein